MVQLTFFLPVLSIRRAELSLASPTSICAPTFFHARGAHHGHVTLHLNHLRNKWKQIRFPKSIRTFLYQQCMNEWHGLVFIECAVSTKWINFHSSTIHLLFTLLAKSYMDPKLFPCLFQMRASRLQSSFRPNSKLAPAQRTRKFVPNTTVLKIPTSFSAPSACFASKPACFPLFILPLWLGRAI